MTKLAFALAAVLAVACSSEKKEPAGSSPTTTNQPAAKNEPAKPEGAAEPVKPEGAEAVKPEGGAGPLAECNEIMAKLEPCYGKLAPDAILRQAHNIMVESVKDFPADATPELNKQMVERCKQHLEVTKAQKEAICPGVNL